MSNKIEPKILLVVDLHSFINIPLIVTDTDNNILKLTSVSATSSSYTLRKQVVAKIKELINEFGVDTIIMEQNRLFIDKIDKYPDPLVMRNITRGFGLQVAIEDNFYECVPYILSIPEYEWRVRVLNRKVTYSIDLYKSHIELAGKFDDAELEEIARNNYYKAICFSESVLFDDLIHRKYQINKGD